MNLFKKYLPFLMLVLVFACSKDDKEEAPDLCAEENFGVLKITFSNTNVKHGLLVTERGTQNATDKIVPIGIESDTLHLKPLTGYIINVSSLDTNNDVIEEDNRSTSVAQCDYFGYTVNF